jgi:hypothetical protein
MILCPLHSETIERVRDCHVCPAGPQLFRCLTKSEETVRTVNVITAGFPATVTGNSDINAKVELPNPCVAPIVFVLAGEENKSFAVTGFEAEEEE